MYSVTITSVDIDRLANQRIVKVTFTKKDYSFSRDFRFGLDISLDVIKRVIKDFKEKLEAAETANTVTEGTLDLSDVVENSPTADEQAQSDWYADLQKLRLVQELITLGVLTGNETPVTTLRNKVRTNFKPTYIN